MSTANREIHIGRGRVLKPTPVLDTYWRFAHARQEMFHRRVAGEPPPWTMDPVLGYHRFTNAYRASDRVSQFLIRNVIYAGPQTVDEVVFRTLFFKIFNKVETWSGLEQKLGTISWTEYDFRRYAEAIDSLRASGASVYSNAYIMPCPAFGEQGKHRNHLRLLEQMMRGRLPDRIADAATLSDVFSILVAFPSLGRFLAFQFAIDLNYSSVCNHSEMDFVVAGPGARDGIRKCFFESAGLADEDLIRIVAERAQEEFDRLELPFRDLWGRSLQLIDCQSLFCEVDKYARVVHPEYRGVSKRSRIKQRFVPADRRLPSQWYPPKWGLQPGGRPGMREQETVPTQLPLQETWTETSTVVSQDPCERGLHGSGAIL